MKKSKKKKKKKKKNQKHKIIKSKKNCLEILALVGK